MKGTGLARKTPAWVGRGATFVYVHVWFYYTAHLLVDDFSKGGVFLFEPVPVSVFRGLGFGAEGDGWWCLGDSGIRWVRGSTWYQTGIAF